MSLFVELFSVKFATDEEFNWHRRTLPLTGIPADPDDIVLRTLDAPMSSDPVVPGCRRLIHSTSWRYERGGKLLLTYLAYSPATNFRGADVSTGRIGVACPEGSGSPDRPRPASIRERDVVLHGLRHLAFLLVNPGHEDFRSVLTPDCLRRFRSLDPCLAGRIGSDFQPKHNGSAWALG